jgi:hypothetical protein
MLWRPVTFGEELFLRLYRELGHPIEVRGPAVIDLDFLIAPQLFRDFARLSATLEIFLRCVRASRHFFETQGHLSPKQVGQALRQEVDLPAGLYTDREFLECAKQTGRIASLKPRSPAIERNATRTEPRQCYLCDVPLTDTPGARDQFTIEHMWPLSLGGDTVEDNLLPACKNCNDTRQHVVTWAWGPVQSTFHASSAGEPPPRELRLSLAVARIMLVAAGAHPGKQVLTLKEAAKKIRPAVVDPEVVRGRHYVYFEMFPRLETV